MELIHYLAMLLAIVLFAIAILGGELRKAKSITAIEVLDKSASNYLKEFAEKHTYALIPRLGIMYHVDDQGYIREKEVRGFHVSKRGISLEIYDHKAQSYSSREEKALITNYNKKYDVIEHEESGYYGSEQVFRGALRFYKEYDLGYRGHMFADEKSAKEFAIVLKHEKMDKELKRYEEELKVLQG
jgi:hypothetical protein